MVEVSIVFGVLIWISIAVIMWKLPRSVTLRLLGRPVLFDSVIAGIVLWIHWGTVTGLMSATVAGIVAALYSTLARAWGGYIADGVYHPGTVRRTA